MKTKNNFKGIEKEIFIKSHELVECLYKANYQVSEELSKNLNALIGHIRFTTLKYE